MALEELGLWVYLTFWTGCLTATQLPPPNDRHSSPSGPAEHFKVCKYCGMEYPGSDFEDQAMSDRLKKYRVWLRSVPGPYAQYDGKVDVFAEDSDQARERALRELRRGAFKDRSDSMWRIEKVEELG